MLIMTKKPQSISSWQKYSKFNRPARNVSLGWCKLFESTFVKKAVRKIERKKEITSARQTPPSIKATKLEARASGLGCHDASFGSRSAALAVGNIHWRAAAALRRRWAKKLRHRRASPKISELLLTVSLLSVSGDANPFTSFYVWREQPKLTPFVLFCFDSRVLFCVYVRLAAMCTMNPNGVFLWRSGGR